MQSEFHEKPASWTKPKGSHVSLPFKSKKKRRSCVKHDMELNCAQKNEWVLAYVETETAARLNSVLGYFRMRIDPTADAKQMYDEFQKEKALGLIKVKPE